MDEIINSLFKDEDTLELLLDSMTHCTMSIELNTIDLIVVVIMKS